MIMTGVRPCFSIALCYYSVKKVSAPGARGFMLTGTVVGASGKGSTLLPEFRHFSINGTLQLWPIAQFEEIHWVCSEKVFSPDLFHNQLHLL